jgi:glycosyltransferase involved in cell wall biosynthesis
MFETQHMSSIAVVVPVHNKRPHINRCLTSILSQTRPIDEIIVIDDASDDGSVGEIAKFADERIRLLKRPVPGPGGYAARNLGILQAKSDWIAFLDADDAWNPSHIEKLALSSTPRLSESAASSPVTKSSNPTEHDPSIHTLAGQKRLACAN